MRPIVALSFVVVAAVGAALPLGCSSNNSSSGFPGGDGGSSSGGSSGGSGGGGSGSGSGGYDGGGLLGDGASGSSSGGGDGGTVTTVYATTDTELYSVDPKTKAVTDIGAFNPTGTITDVAVNGKGDIYVNSESTLYSVALPAGGSGPVALTKVATFSGSKNYFYALAFAPMGALSDTDETLVAGDSNGALWSVDTGSGASTELGSFGSDPYISGNTFELSGDVVFYLSGSPPAPTGLATIRSCSSSSCKNDFLAAIDMTALKTAFKSGSPAPTLLSGIYGATKTSNGPGTGFYGVYGLAAWDATVFGFTYVGYDGSTKPSLITIDTTSGAGTLVSDTFSFSEKGWSGAGVTTTVNVVVPPPMMSQ